MGGRNRKKCKRKLEKLEMNYKAKCRMGKLENKHRNEDDHVCIANGRWKIEGNGQQEHGLKSLVIVGRKQQENQFF